MKQFEIGMLVKSKAGHDQGNYYVIVDMQSEYLYLADGFLRTLAKPKKKKKMHVQRIDLVFEEIQTKVQNQTLIDEEIKRALKQYKTEKQI